MPFPGWAAFLAKGEPTEAEYDEAEALAAEWPTCPIGELHQAYPLTLQVEADTDAPEDRILRDWGVAFHGAIYKWDLPHAQLLYADMQARVADLARARRDPNG